MTIAQSIATEGDIARAGSSTVEQSAHNRTRAGSTPAPPTRSPIRALPPRTIGELSELDVYAALHRAGYTVLICPFRAARYDCVIDTGEQLVRVQVKTGHVARGAVVFHTCTTNPYRSTLHNAYHGEADVFAVWVPELRRLWLVPVAECGARKAMLRLEPARNNQRAGVRWAADYEVREAACAGC